MELTTGVHLVSVLRMPWVLPLFPVYATLPRHFSPVAHLDFSKIHDSTPQNFVLQKGSMKQYMAINMHLHINTCPIRMQTYENKTLHMLIKTNDDER
jgi:hypothetical protein